MKPIKKESGLKVQIKALSADFNEYKVNLKNLKEKIS